MTKIRRRRRRKKDSLARKTRRARRLEHDSLETASDSVDQPEVNEMMLRYISEQGLGVAHACLSGVLKGALVLGADEHCRLLRVSWRLLQQSDCQVVLSAASSFIVSSVKRPEEAVSIMRAALASRDPSERSAAIQRFYTLWRNRFHVWLKMEDGAQTTFKVPPLGIDFTLPSPLVGQSHPPVVDPPWMPHMKSKVEELSLKEEEHATSQTIMTMTRTRRKQKQEMARRAVKEAEEKECEFRQLYPLRAASLAQLAAYEPALFQHSPDSDETDVPHSSARTHQMPVAQPLFPSSLLSVVPTIVELLDDPHVDSNGMSVSESARKVIWACLVEEPGLFLRHFLERMTNREQQWEYLMSLLRKLIMHLSPFPSQAAFTLLNYLFGFVMHYVRGSCEGAETAISQALSLSSLLVSHVNGLYFKDLKQTLKKEQCDQALMITANVPSAKILVVHGPDSSSGGIPTQFPVHEDTQFLQILSDSLEFFNIEDYDQDYEYVLADTKTGIVHSPNSYVRDFYFFHRSFYPQLTVLRLKSEEARRRMRSFAFSHKLCEIGKVLITHNILVNSPSNVMAQRIFFLHDELTHLPSFPRKSLDSCFGMYEGPLGEQLRAVDALHKFVWAKLMSDMFERMENAFIFADLHLFINVINGIFIAHCEDLLILRRCAATYISIAIHFNSLFSSQVLILSSDQAAFRGPQRTFDLVNTVSERGKSLMADSPQFFDPPTMNEDENIKPFHMKEKKSTGVGVDSVGGDEHLKEQFRRPRDTLLSLAASFILIATPRLKELTKLSPTSEHAKIPDVLDHKCHVKLSEVALSLLKVAPYDLGTLSSVGLQKYFVAILPITDWSLESNRSALNIILRRLDKTIAKIAKKQSIRRRVNWGALSAWLQGLCDTLSAFPYIAHLHSLKTTTQMCLRIVAGDCCVEEGATGASLSSQPSTVFHISTPPSSFCNATLRLTSILIQALGQMAFSLEFVCSVEGMGVMAERVEAVLCHLLIPLFLRHAHSKGGESSGGIIQIKDLAAIISHMHAAITAPAGKSSVAPLISTSTLASSFMRGASQAHELSGRQGSVSVTERGQSATVSTQRIVRDSVPQAIFLALKVMIVCYDKQLTPLWPRLARLVRDLLSRRSAGSASLSFVDFILSTNFPISLLLLPLIQAKVLSYFLIERVKPTGEVDAQWQAEAEEKLERKGWETPPTQHALLASFQRELAALKEELSAKPLEMPRSYTPTMAETHSDASSIGGRSGAQTVKGRPLDRRSSSHGKGGSRLHHSTKEAEKTIPEDIEEDDSGGGGPSISKSPAAKEGTRQRAMSGFGGWRSGRRKSKHLSSGDSQRREPWMEMVDIGLPPSSLTPKRDASRRSTESSLHPMQEQPAASDSRQRYVSFSTPSRPGDDVFDIIEQHQLV